MQFDSLSQFYANSSIYQATEEKAENARLSSFVGALALGDLVKSTLGPKGMNKILQSMSSGDINVTNDGATILKAIQLDNAAAKILVNISKVQDDEVGDGTTSVTVLAAELLREAEKLIGMKIHPQTIVEGYRIASAAALKALEDAAVDHGCVVVVIVLCDRVDLMVWYHICQVGCFNVPARPCQHCTDDTFVQGVVAGQRLLLESRRRCGPPAKGEDAAAVNIVCYSLSTPIGCAGIDRLGPYPGHQKSRWKADRFVS